MYGLVSPFPALILEGYGNKIELSLRISLFCVVLSGHWGFVLSLSVSLVDSVQLHWLCGSIEVAFFLWKTHTFINMTEMFVLSSLTVFYAMLSVFIMDKIFYFLFLSND